MTFSIEIVLRDTDRAVTERASHPADPSSWSEAETREVLKTILTAIDRARNPDAPPREVTLRGFSWIVEPSEGQVVIAIEIPTGAAVAGPFDIEEARLTQMIARALGRASSTTAVH
ncbi:MAG: hypothetical protein ACRD09_14175 [Vicinamibacterales bacterium]